MEGKVGLRRLESTSWLKDLFDCISEQFRRKAVAWNRFSMSRSEWLPNELLFYSRSMFKRVLPSCAASGLHFTGHFNLSDPTGSNATRCHCARNKPIIFHCYHRRVTQTFFSSRHRPHSHLTAPSSHRQSPTSSRAPSASCGD